MTRRRTKTEDTQPEAPQETALTAWSAKSTGLALSKAEMGRALMGAGDRARTGGGDGSTYLSFSGKSGRWALGKDKEPRSEDWLGIVDHAQTREGWTCWKGGKGIAKKAWSVYTPERSVGFGELEDHGPYNERAGEGWKDMVSVGLLMFGTEQDGAVQATYETNAVSARNVLADLQKSIAAQILSDAPEYPLVELGEEEFEAQGQVNYKPVLTVLEWLTEEQVAALVANPDGVYDLVDNDEPAPPPPPPEPSRRQSRRRA